MASGGRPGAGTGAPHEDNDRAPEQPAAPPAGLGDACRRLAENTFAGVVADGYPVCGSIDMAAVASNLYL